MEVDDLPIQFPKFDSKLSGKLKEFKYPFPTFIFKRPQEGAELITPDPPQPTQSVSQTESNESVDALTQDEEDVFYAVQIPEIGLINNGENMCYANSGIQVLARTTSLVAHLTSFNRIPQSFGCFKNGIYHRLSRVLNSMTQGRPEHLSYFIAWLRSKLNLENIFISNTQNDSAELLQKVLEMIHEEIKQAVEIVKQKDKPAWTQSIEQVQMEFRKSCLFTKTITKNYQCACGYQINNQEVHNNEFFQIIVIPQKAKTLQDCFDELSSNKSKVKCPQPNCRETVQMRETLEFMEKDDIKMPENLFIQLNIFQTNKNRNGFVKTKNTLFSQTSPTNLIVYLKASNGQKIAYQVQTLVCHDGNSPLSGHYVTIDRKLDGQWVMYNDALVESINTQKFVEYVKRRTPYLICLKRVADTCKSFDTWNENKFCLTGKNAELNALLTATVGLQIADRWEDKLLRAVTRMFRGNFTPPNTDIMNGFYSLKSVKGCHAVLKELMTRDRIVSNCLVSLELKPENNLIHLDEILNREFQGSEIPQKDLIMFFKDHNEYKRNLNISRPVILNYEQRQYSWKVSSVIIKPTNAYHVYQTYESNWYKFEYSSTHFEKFAKLEKIPEQSTSCLVVVLKYQGVSVIHGENMIGLRRKESNLESFQNHEHVPDVLEDLASTSDHEPLNDMMDDEARVPIVTSPIVVQNHDHNDSNQSDGVVPQNETQIYSNFEEFVLQEIKQQSAKVEMNCCEKQTLFQDETAFKMLGVIRPPPSIYKKNRDINMKTTVLAYEFPVVLQHYLTEHQPAEPVLNLWDYCYNIWPQMTDANTITEDGETGAVHCFQCENCKLKIYYKNNKFLKMFAPIYHYLLYHGHEKEFINNQKLFSTFQSYCEAVKTAKNIKKNASSKTIATVCPICGETLTSPTSFLDGQRVQMFDSENHTVAELMHFLKKHHRKPGSYINCSLLDNWEHRNWNLFEKQKLEKQESRPITTKMARKSLEQDFTFISCHICGMRMQKKTNTAAVKRDSIGNNDPTIVEHNRKYHLDADASCPFCKKVIPPSKVGMTRHGKKCEKMIAARLVIPEVKKNSINDSGTPSKVPSQARSLKKTPTLKLKVNGQSTDKPSPALTRARAAEKATAKKDPKIPENNPKASTNKGELGGPMQSETDNITTTTTSPAKVKRKGNKKKVPVPEKRKSPHLKPKTINKPKSPTALKQTKKVADKPHTDMETPLTSGKKGKKRRRGKKNPKQNSQDESGSGSSDQSNDSQTPEKPKSKKR